MGLYLSADRLAEAITRFERSFKCGLPKGGSKDVVHFRKHFEKLTPFARSAFREEYPALWANWIKPATRARPKHGDQRDLFDA